MTINPVHSLTRVCYWNFNGNGNVYYSLHVPVGKAIVLKFLASAKEFCVLLLIHYLQHVLDSKPFKVPCSIKENVLIVITAQTEAQYADNHYWYALETAMLAYYGGFEGHFRYTVSSFTLFAKIWTIHKRSCYKFIQALKIMLIMYTTKATLFSEMFCSSSIILKPRYFCKNYHVKILLILFRTECAQCLALIMLTS